MRAAPPRLRAHRGLVAFAFATALCASAALAQDGEMPPARARAPEASDAPRVPARPLRILALGDSYTIGEGVSEPDRWPEQLRRALEARGLPVAAPRIIARTGWTTADLARAVAAAELDPPYDLVTLLIGVNDQFQGYRPAGYPERFAALLARAIELAGGRERVIVVSIPDYGVTPFGRRFGGDRASRELSRYNRTNREITQKEAVAYVDITPGSLRAETAPDLLARDGLHPSAILYAEWVRQIAPLAERALRGHTRAPQ